MNIMRLLNPIALVLVIVGALNWGLVGVFEFYLVGGIHGDTFGETNPVSRIVYVLVGAAGVYLALTVLPAMFRSTDRPGRGHIAQASAHQWSGGRHLKGRRPPTVSGYCVSSTMRATLDGFESMERRNADRSLVTEQRLRVASPVVPFTEDGARALGSRYWREVEGASRGLVRCRET